MASPTLQSIKNINVILASGSQWRSKILHQIGIPHKAIPHKIDEKNHPCLNGIEKYVIELALLKGKSIRPHYPNALIIASDQIIVWKGKILGKPGTLSIATKQLQSLQGDKHILYTSIAVLYQHHEMVRMDSASLKMRKLSRKEIEYYIQQDKPWDCAGSYKIESLGASLFEEIQAQDPHTIMGLPVILLLDMLREFGFSNLF